MNASDLLAFLKTKDIQLRAEGDRLRYNAPKGALTPEIREQLKQNKHELLTLLQADTVEIQKNVLPLKRISRDGELPISTAQKRMWFLEHLEPDNPAANIPRAISIKGPLNITALEQSFNEIVRRHEIFRTTCATVNGEPVLTISPVEPFKMQMIDISDLNEERRDKEVEKLAVEEVKKLFDIETDLLIRVTLLQLGPDDYVLLMTMHHFAVDGWSLGILYRELSSIYESILHCKTSSLRDFPFQYIDYADWLQKNIQTTVKDKQLAYWKKQLAGAPSCFTLPVDHPRPPVLGYQCDTQTFKLSEQLSERIRIFIRQEGVTLFMFLLSAFKVLIHRYTYQDDCVIGTAVSNRKKIEAEKLIGPFANNLVLRSDLSGNPTFKKLLLEVRDMCVAAYTNQDFPYEDLLDELQPYRSLSQNPLFQIFFNLHEFDMTYDLKLPGLDIHRLPIDLEATRFDISLNMSDKTGGIWGRLQYNTDLYELPTVLRLITQYKTILQSIIDNPDQHIRELDIISEHEKQELLTNWNRTYERYENDAVIHHIFEEQAGLTPDAIALKLYGHTLTFKELNEKANCIAHYLRKHGVQDESLIGLCAEPSFEMIAGILGVLKSGGAYVPLDPEYPQDRLAFMLRDAGVNILLTQEGIRQKIPAGDADVVCLDADWPLIGKESIQNPKHVSGAQNIAYVIYTSGSTGRPKGVVGLHKGAVNRFNWMWHQYPFSSDDICCQKTSLSFVDSVWEIFGPLLKGVPLIIIPEAERKDTQQFIRTLSENHITRIVVVPSLLSVMLDLYPDLQSRLPYLKYWTVSGEEVSKDLCMQFYHAMPGNMLLNIYGSSEVSADVTCYDTRALTEGTLKAPIGKPISNTTVYILDHYMNPVPVGMQGELYVGGDCLARGYYNRPDLTGERFMPNPFSNEPGERFFKTGDLARYLEDGNIEYAGRLDFQVKVRGFRIELGEIETVLRDHTAIREVIVSADKDNSGDIKIAAYFITENGQQPSIDELRQYLSSQLPDYMLPSAFVPLDSFPLLPNGKIDRHSLPQPDYAVQQTDHEFIKPRDDFERKLVDIWEDVLGVNPISINDNFFAIGGHSLLAVRLFAKIENVFHKKLPIATLFQAPTIMSLSELFCRHMAEPSISPLVAIQQNGPKPPLFLMHPVGGQVLCYHDLANCLGMEQPVYGLQAIDDTIAGIDFTTFGAMASRYIEEMRAVQPKGPYFLGGLSFGGLLAYEIACRLSLQGEHIGLIALFDTNVIKLPRYYEIQSGKSSKIAKTAWQLRRLLSWLIFSSFAEKRASFLHRINMFKMDVPYIPGLEDIMGENPFGTDPKQHAIIKRNFQAACLYKPEQYPGKVVLFKSMDEAAFVFYDKETYGWKELALGGVDVHNVAGNHISLIKDRNAQIIAEKIKEYIVH